MCRSNFKEYEDNVVQANGEQGMEGDSKKKLGFERNIQMSCCVAVARSQG